MIDGVVIKPLKMIPDERGRLMEIFRNDDDLFTAFGQVYLTTAYPGVVKGWHLHREQTDHMVVVKGMMKIVLYDDREGSKTRGEVQEFFIGELRPSLLRIPKGVYHGFKCISETEALVINVPDRKFDYAEPDEIRLPAHGGGIPYDWGRKDG